MNVAELIKSLQETPNPSATEVRVGNGATAQVVAAGDYTGGTPDEDQFDSVGHGITDGDRLQLTYKSDAGAVTGDVGDVFYALVADPDIFQIALTEGGAAVENTADGTAIFRNLSTFAVDVETDAEREGIDSADAGFVTIG